MTRAPVPLALLTLLVVAAVAPVPAAAAASETVPVRAPETVNLAGVGQVAVTVLSTSSVDATTIDTDSIRLSGGRTGVGVARSADGRPLALVTDADNDRRTDVTLLFDKPTLRATGELTATTTALTLRGRLADGRDLTGTAKVATAVVLEVKFRRGSAPTTAKSTVDRHRAVDLEPLLPAQTLAALSPSTDMASWYQLTLPADADPTAAVKDLTALSSVETAYPAPEPAPSPATPDFTAMQGYQRPAPQGRRRPRPAGPAFARRRGAHRRPRVRLEPVPRGPAPRLVE